MSTIQEVITCMEQGGHAELDGYLYVINPYKKIYKMVKGKEVYFDLSPISFSIQEIQSSNWILHPRIEFLKCIYCGIKTIEILNKEIEILPKNNQLLYYTFCHHCEVSGPKFLYKRDAIEKHNKLLILLENNK